MTIFRFQLMFAACRRHPLEFLLRRLSLFEGPQGQVFGRRFPIPRMAPAIRQQMWMGRMVRRPPLRERGRNLAPSDC